MKLLVEKCVKFIGIILILEFWRHNLLFSTRRNKNSYEKLRKSIPKSVL